MQPVVVAAAIVKLNRTEKHCQWSSCTTRQIQYLLQMIVLYVFGAGNNIKPCCFIGSVWTAVRER